METIAENSFTVNKEIYKEGIYRLIESDIGSFRKKMLIILGVLWVALAAYILYIGRGYFYLPFGLLVVGLVALWLMVLTPNSKVKRGWRAMQDRTDGEILRTVKFYEDCLTVDNGAAVKTINYENIHRRLESKHLLILVDDEKTGVMVALDGFTKGNKETVLKAIDDWVRTEN